MELQVITSSPRHNYAIDPSLQHSSLNYSSLFFLFNVSQDQEEISSSIIWQLCWWAQKKQCKRLQNIITIQSYVRGLFQGTKCQIHSPKSFSALTQLYRWIYASGNCNRTFWLCLYINININIRTSVAVKTCI